MHDDAKENYSQAVHYMAGEIFEPMMMRMASLMKPKKPEVKWVSLIDPFDLSPYNIYNEVGHALLNVLEFIPGVGDVADTADMVSDGKVIAGRVKHPERVIQTPDGVKNSRRPDGSLYGINVGKQL